jgi:hypothetical protein
MKDSKVKQILSGVGSVAGERINRVNKDEWGQIW